MAEAGEGITTKPTVLGGEVSVPLYTPWAEVYEEWSDGNLSLGDFTAPVAGSLETIGTVFNPLGAVTGSVAGWVMNLIYENIQPARDAIDALTGDPERINHTSQAWYRTGLAIQQVAQAHAASIADVQTWTGQAADLYRQTHQNTTKVVVMASESAHRMGTLVNGVGILVASSRAIMAEMIRETVSTIMQAAIVAAAGHWRPAS